MKVEIIKKPDLTNEDLCRGLRILAKIIIREIIKREGTPMKVSIIKDKKVG